MFKYKLRTGRSSCVLDHPVLVCKLSARDTRVGGEQGAKGYGVRWLVPPVTCKVGTVILTLEGCQEDLG